MSSGLVSLLIPRFPQIPALLGLLSVQTSSLIVSEHSPPQSLLGGLLRLGTEEGYVENDLEVEGNQEGWVAAVFSEDIIT